MTLQEIAKRLKEEFPEGYVSFTIDISKYSQRSYTEIDINIYHGKLGRSIECKDFEDGIQKLHLALKDYVVKPDMEISFA